MSGYSLAHFRVVMLQRDLGFCDSVQIRIDDDDAEDWILIVGAVQLVIGAAEVLALTKI